MLANSGIKFFHLHFSSLIAFVFSGGVEMTGASTGNQFDFISHDCIPLDFFAASSHISDDGINALFIDKTHAAGRNTQANPAVLTGYPVPVVVQVRQKASLGFIVGM